MHKEEHSAGGVVLDGNKVLLISVVNFRKQKVWTFPKGHIEESESPRQSAVREVEEETGYRCSIIKPMLKASYFFTLNRQKIKKTVKWFLMKPNFRISKIDTAEITGILWVSFKKASRMLRYQSDIELIDMVENFLEEKNKKIKKNIHSKVN
ncbi:MAG TPA: NUDIX hydrolase [Elusimicrobiales bacterium]|nr:NUDIX hydrolase [Elusimicrobiales bacterium]